MRTGVTDAIKKELFASESGDVPIILIRISHPDLEDDILVNSSGIDVDHDGDTYLFYPFELILPDDQEGSNPRARLSIDNCDRTIVLAIRSINSPATVDFKVVYYSDLEAVQASFSDFKLVNVTYDQNVVQGDLTIEDFTTEPFPAASFTPELFPGLF